MAVGASVPRSERLEAVRTRLPNPAVLPVAEVRKVLRPDAAAALGRQEVAVVDVQQAPALPKPVALIAARRPVP